MDEAAMAIHLRNVAVTLSHVRTRVLDGRPISETDRLLGDAREAILNIAAEVERLREIDKYSEEGFAVRVLREASSRGDDFVIEAQGGKYLARVKSEAIMSLLNDKVLREQEAARG